MEETRPRSDSSGAADATSPSGPVSAFRAPVSRAEIVRRGHPPVSAVSVVAPAGYGKSVLLEQWGGLDGRLPVRLSLTRADGDLPTLAASVASAFSAALGGDPAFASIAERPGSGRAVLARTATRLQTLIAAAARPFVLLLDDADFAYADACQDLLEVAFGRLPLKSLLVVAGRGPQPFLSRLRLSGRVLDVGSRELALDAAGIQRVFAHLGAPRLSDADAQRLCERTLGWAAGATLAGLAARAGDDPLGLLGEDRPVADFLTRAVVAEVGREERTFLRESAIFDPVEPSACDAVLGLQDSGARLRELESRGLLLSPTDTHRTAYRYHPLFREFLLGELARTAPGRAKELHRAAASWHESRGQVQGAVDHLLAAGESERGARLIAGHVLGTFEAGDRASVHRWLDALGGGTIESFPPLLAAAGWCSALDGRPTAADRWADLLEDREFGGEAVAGLPSTASARAMLRALLWRRGLDAAAEDAAFAVRCEEAASGWRDHALLLLGWTLSLGGRAGEAAAAFEEASRLAATAGHTMSLVLCEAELARSAMRVGTLTDVDRQLDRALGAVEAAGLDGSPAACLVRAVAARRAFRRGDSSAAVGLLSAAMRDRGVCTFAAPVLAVEVRLELCRAQLARGAAAAAAHLLREVDDVLWLRAGLGSLEAELDELREELRRGSAVLGPSPLTPAELRLLPLLQTHLTIAEIASRLFVSRNTAGTQIGSIYRKLGVSSRGGAVQRAAEVGLLG